MKRRTRVYQLIVNLFRRKVKPFIIEDTKWCDLEDTWHAP